jgi:hypothetical protein
MIPVSFIWDTRKRSVYIKWNGFFSLGWEKGKILKKMFGLTIPIPLSGTSGKVPDMVEKTVDIIKGKKQGA